jgi:hypothetical protein
MFRSADGWADDFQRKPVVTFFKVVAWIVLLILLVVGAVWGFRTGFSYWWGKGDAYQQKQSAQNWVAAQRGFHQEVSDYQADLSKITDAETALRHFETGAAPDPDTIAGFEWQQQDTNLRTTVTGLRQQCQQVVASYSTDSLSYLTMSFKDAGLPTELDGTRCAAGG